MNFSSIVVCLFLIVACTSAIKIGPTPFASFTVNLPSNGVKLVDTLFIGANKDGEDGQYWAFVPESVDACKDVIPGLTIDPTHSILDSELRPIKFTLDPNAYGQTQQQECILLLKDETDAIQIYLNLNVISDWCTYHKPSYCNGGTCNNVTHSCDCQEYFYGPVCNTYCKKETTCGDHGTCATDGTCICDKNYYGQYCDIFCDPMTNCSNKGQCSVFGTCMCNEYYFGYKCDTFCNATAMCSGHGSCDFFGTGCNCTNTHWGTHCENECPCSEKGHCNSTGHCVCDNHYFGEKCDVKCTEEDNCNSHGYCAEDGVSCICFDDHLGSTCSVNKVVFGMSIGLAGLLVLILGVFLIRECQKRKSIYQQIQ